LNDNFFALGGHSLLAMQVMSRLRDEFDVSLSLRALFDAPTVLELAAEIERIDGTSTVPSPPKLVRVQRVKS
jgi:acyl carrier protein